jgi:hypothetical protein
MRSREEIISEVNKGLVFNSYPISEGLQVGVPKGVSIYSEDLDIEIRVNNYNSRFKNMELAKTLMSLAIEECITVMSR